MAKRKDRFTSLRLALTELQQQDSASVLGQNVELMVRVIIMQFCNVLECQEVVAIKLKSLLLFDLNVFCTECFPTFQKRNIKKSQSY